MFMWIIHCQRTKAKAKALYSLAYYWRNSTYTNNNEGFHKKMCGTAQLSQCTYVLIDIIQMWKVVVWKPCIYNFANIQFKLELHKISQFSWRSVRVTQNKVILIKGSTPHAIIKMKILLGSGTIWTFYVMVVLLNLSLIYDFNPIIIKIFLKLYNNT